MTIPAIRNYETRPPVGGWGVEYTLRGQKFTLTGGWNVVAQKLARLQKRNGEFRSMDDVFEYLNNAWCAKDPERCMPPAMRTAAMKRAGSTCGRCGGRRRIR